jgi:hypothetical protein
MLLSFQTIFEGLNCLWSYIYNMKTYFLVILLLLGIANCAKSQADDSAYYGNKEYRAVMGGGQRVHYDTITTLNNLIKRLDKPWKFVETYKAYWIGYTDDMYSIARYQDKAIDPLINFIDTVHSLKAKKGALFTLHLIGINFRVVGRFTEDFENKNARDALLRYLNDSSLNETVVYLLMRDPWLSDLPKFIKYLSRQECDYSKVLNGLQRYNFDGKPFGQKITDTIFKRIINVNGPRYRDWRLYELIAFEREFGRKFIVDNEITKSTKWKESLKKLPTNNLLKLSESFDFYINSNLAFSYIDFVESYAYTFSNHQVIIYGPTKARQIWLNWWKGLSQNDKDNLFVSDHVALDSN